MLATIALSSVAICDLSQGPAPHQRKHHREFTELLMKHGVLVFGSEDEKNAFTNSIRVGEGIPIFSRQAWGVLIADFANKKRLRVVPPPGAPQLSSLTSLKDLYDEWKHKTEIAVVGESFSQVMRLDQQESGVLEGTALEIATPITVSEGKIIRSLEALSRDGKLKYGEGREVFWSTVLAPLAECTRNIVITDRFVFERMWDDADANHNRQAPEHVCWLLDRLDSTLLPQATVKIVGQSRRKDSPTHKRRWTTQETVDMIRKNWTRAEFQRIERVEIVQAEPYGERPHDRHIRFGDVGLIDINAGVDMLSMPTVMKKQGMKWSYGYTPDALRESKEATKLLEAKPSYLNVIGS